MTVLGQPAAVSGGRSMPAIPGRKMTLSQTQESIIAASGEDALRSLLAGIARQDEDSLASFYDLTSGRVYAFVLRITRHPPLAEEVAADVYLQAWQQAERYDPGRGAVLTWLLTIARSRALDHLRKSDPAELTGEPEALLDTLDSGEPDPQDLLLAVERQSAVHAALEKLRPVQRRLISLAFFQGLTHQEIAAHTGLPLGTVKTHLRKAMQVLREELSRTPAVSRG